MVNMVNMRLRLLGILISLESIKMIRKASLEFFKIHGSDFPQRQKIIF